MPGMSSGRAVGWVGAGFQVTGGNAALDLNYGAMLASMAGYNTVKQADILLIEMDGDIPPFVLDVRSTAELKMAVI